MFIDKSVKEYTDHKRQDGIWGDSLEIHVFCQIFNVSITIYYYNDTPLASFSPNQVITSELIKFRDSIYEKYIEAYPEIETSIRNFESLRRNQKGATCLNLLYRNGNHYDCLIPMNPDEFTNFYRSLSENVSQQHPHNQQKEKFNQLEDHQRLNGLINNMDNIQKELSTIREDNLKEIREKSSTHVELDQGKMTFEDLIKKTSTDQLDKDFNKIIQKTSMDSEKEDIERKVIEMVIKDSCGQKKDEYGKGTGEVGDRGGISCKGVESEILSSVMKESLQQSGGQMRIQESDHTLASDQIMSQLMQFGVSWEQAISYSIMYHKKYHTIEEILNQIYK